MKTLRFCLIATSILLNLVSIQTTQAKRLRTKSEDVALISAQEAMRDFKLYLNKQIAKRNLKLTDEQIEAFITKSRSLIYENSQDGKISKKDSRQIQKDFKLYLKTSFPNNFKIKRSKNEVNYKLARRRIRATTKDFVANKLQVTGSAEIKESWNKVKDMVYRKLDKAAYFNDFNELVVDESAIVQIIGKVFEKLENEKAGNTTLNPDKTDSPKRKRKAAVPVKISSPIAEKLVRLMIRNKGISAKQNETLTQKVMQKISKKVRKGYVEKETVIEITKQEIKNFLELKSKVTKEPRQRYLDRFIAAMGKTPETNINE